MKCKKPFDLGDRESAFRCGSCLHCRIFDRSIWASRIMLETLFHPSSVFLTLTYDNDHLPQGFVHPKTGEVFEPGLQPAHLRTFMNDLRGHADRKLGIRLRFYGVGEYGEKLARPHYHIALFGFPGCLGPGPIIFPNRFVPCPCRHCRFVTDIWSKGNTFLGTLTSHSANYIAGYIEKKLTHSNSEWNQRHLLGRHPEFSRMSNRPYGIGGLAADHMAAQLTRYGFTDKLNVPSTLIRDGRELLLGRYLTGRLHEKMGFTYDEGEKLEISKQRLFAMLDDHKVDTREIFKTHASVSSHLAFLNIQHSRDLETRQIMSRKDRPI